MKFYGFVLALLLVTITGYISNIIWLISNDGGMTGHVILGIAGLFLFPIGAINGIIVLF